MFVILKCTSLYHTLKSKLHPKKVLFLCGVKYGSMMFGQKQFGRQTFGQCNVRSAQCLAEGAVVMAFTQVILTKWCSAKKFLMKMRGAAKS
jgi:hypothetical protein